MIQPSRQPGFLFEPTLIAEASVLGCRVVDLGHFFQRLAVLGRHQFEPIEFGRRSLGVGGDSEATEQREDECAHKATT